MWYVQMWLWVWERLYASQHWMWDKLSQLFGWMFHAVPGWYWSRPAWLGVLLLLTYLLIGVWMARKSREDGKSFAQRRPSASDVMVVFFWGPILDGVALIGMVTCFYIVWIVVAFCALLGAGFLAFFEYPARWVGSLF